MNSKYKAQSLFKKVTILLSNKNKFRVLVLIGLILVSSIAEIVSIGSVIPFLMAVGDPSKLYQNEELQFLWIFLGIDSVETLPFLFAIVFGSAAIISGSIRLFTLYIAAHVNRSIVVEFSTKVFRSLLYKKYEDHSSENSGFIRGILGSKIDQISMAFQGVTLMITGGIIASCVVIFLIIYNPMVTLGLIIFFTIFYGVVISYFNSLLESYSKIRAEHTSKMMTLINDAINGFREIALNGSQKIISDAFESREYNRRTSEAKVGVIANFPRFVIESIGLFFLALFTMYLSQKSGNFTEAIPLLALFAMAFQRILPLVQQTYNGWAILRGTSQSIDDALSYVLTCKEELLEEFVEVMPMPFTNKITVSDLDFSYSHKEKIIKNFSITIPKGSKVGIYGKTGSGKTTFSDLLMGFLMPQSGQIIIDDTVLTKENIGSWQRNISQVPQKIYVKDSTILENITLEDDINKVDINLAKEALIKANLADFSNNLSYLVGEDGINLSGGQIQRLGIARALYSKSNIIFFDEPTSSLDNFTAKKIFSTIYALSNEKTIFIISHDQDALKDCDILLNTKDAAIDIKTA